VKITVIKQLFSYLVIKNIQNFVIWGLGGSKRCETDDKTRVYTVANALPPFDQKIRFKASPLVGGFFPSALCPLPPAFSLPGTSLSLVYKARM
jgi:hypothetical protein